jgi:hypothetical protein
MLRQGFDDRDRCPRPLSEPTVFRWYVQAEESVRAQRRDGIPGKSRVAVDLGSPRRDLAVRNRYRSGHNPLLRVIQPIHVVLHYDV